ncbi:hypothetical protein MJO28_013293 [Puccinia striiformis f. sp. tritici]|uniref:Uncharacterized protein n=1 Tax=Puccinia striiformis f. sp. tritici TaxID=168172 RepID=A0ACC0DZC1_9BASI|nr:hypothetical protein Pst134EB_024936 [Puccinia striiformis f. sp. tritici]KAI7941008.1 hypothetical protein MJO28_013293 [Puccinia striiformis f. sp. tritici]KAI9606705.1 hypothetical protein H4Q26_006242 [Puccinia striiformis f. sp. tritici PST-130]
MSAAHINEEEERTTSMSSLGPEGGEETTSNTGKSEANAEELTTTISREIMTEETEEEEPDTPTSACSGLARTGVHDLVEPEGYQNDLPSLTPSKQATSSVSDSDSDSIPERFTDEDLTEDLEEDEDGDGPTGLLDQLNLNSTLQTGIDRQSNQVNIQRTPSSQTSITSSHISFSEPAPLRINSKLGRKRSLSALVALRYRGGKGDSEIGDEERGLLALDLDTYINSGEPEIPETRALPPTALFPTLTTVLQAAPMGTNRTGPNGRRIVGGQSNTTTTTIKRGQEEETDQGPGLTISLHHDGLLIPTPRSEWPFGGGTGPGKTSRGFIPGRSVNLLSPTTPTPNSTSSTSISDSTNLSIDS